MPDSRRPSVDLPGPAGPDDRQPLAGAQPQVDAVQHVVALAVGEAEVLGGQLDPVGQPVAGLAIGRHLGDAEQAAGRGRAHLQAVDLADHGVERLASATTYSIAAVIWPRSTQPLVVAVGAHDEGDDLRHLEGAR